SMAAPVVAGTAALMLQANPALTPNAVKAILQYTAQTYAGYDALTQGAGFLNAYGAIALAQFLAAPDRSIYPAASGWSQQLIWGSRVVSGGQIGADANAWAIGVDWGAATTPAGTGLVWGTVNGTNGLVWGGISADAPNIVWGSTCGGLDCQTVWTTAQAGSAVFATDADTIVCGRSDFGTGVCGTTGTAAF